LLELIDGVREGANRSGEDGMEWDESDTKNLMRSEGLRVANSIVAGAVDVRMEFVTHLPISSPRARGYTSEELSNDYNKLIKDFHRTAKMRFSRSVKLNKVKFRIGLWDVYTTVDWDANDVEGAIYYLEKEIMDVLNILGSSRDSNELIFGEWSDRRFYTDVL